MKSLATMQAEVVEFCVAKGWSGPGAPEKTFGDCMALLTSEVSEALEAFRVWGLKPMVRFKFDPRQAFGKPTLDVTGMDCSRVSEDDGGYNADVKPEGVASEFADVFIRLLDDCDRFGIDLEAEYERKMRYNRTRSFRHGGKAL